jgi:hypothetical protein
LNELITTSAGFLLAVLWMDLMFDVQVLRQRRAAQLSEDVLASIAAYYRRVTIDANPMSRLVALAMLVMLLCLVVQLRRGAEPLWLTSATLVLGLPPAVLALTRVVPNAMRLGTRRDSLAEQSRLARAICRDHLFCLAAILGLLALRLAAHW